MHDIKQIAKTMADALKKTSMDLSNIESLLSLLQTLFSDYPDISYEDSRKILRRLIPLSLHPDKSVNASAEEKALNSKVLQALNNIEEQQWEAYWQAVRPASHKQTTKEVIKGGENFSFIGSNFSSGVLEGSFAFLSRTYPDIGEWSKKKTFEPPLQFIRVIRSQIRLEDTIGVNPLLTHLMLIDAFAEALLPQGESLTDFIKSLLEKQRDEIASLPNRPSPILEWLRNQLVLEYAKSVNFDVSNRLPVDVYPSLQDIIQVFELNRSYPNKERLEKFISKWPNSRLPHLKNIFQQTLKEFDDRYLKVSNEIKKIEVNIEDRSIHVTLPSSRYFEFKSIYEYDREKNKLNFLADASVLQNLERMRRSLQYTFNELPAFIMSYSYYENNTSTNETIKKPILGETLGEILLNQLQVLNEAINAQREKMGLIKENPNFQPQFIIEYHELGYVSPITNQIVPYVEENKSIKNDTRLARGELKLGSDDALYCIPEYLDPVLSKVLSDCNERLNNTKFFDHYKKKPQQIENELKTILQTIPDKYMQEPELTNTIAIMGTLLDAMGLPDEDEKRCMFARLIAERNSGRNFDYQTLHINKFLSVKNRIKNTHQETNNAHQSEEPATNCAVDVTNSQDSLMIEESSSVWRNKIVEFLRGLKEHIEKQTNLFTLWNQKDKLENIEKIIHFCVEQNHLSHHEQGRLLGLIEGVCLMKRNAWTHIGSFIPTQSSNKFTKFLETNHEANQVISLSDDGLEAMMKLNDISDFLNHEDYFRQPSAAPRSNP